MHRAAGVDGRGARLSLPAAMTRTWSSAWQKSSKLAKIMSNRGGNLVVVAASGLCAVWELEDLGGCGARPVFLLQNLMQKKCMTTFESTRRIVEKGFT